MANIIIAKNQTAGNIFIEDLGLDIPALSSLTITDFVNYIEAAVSQDLESEILAGNIILNNGTTDFSLVRSLNYLDSSGSFNGPDTTVLDNSLLRLDGTTGNFSKATGITIDNADNINLNAGSITNAATINSIVINASTINVGSSPLSINDLADVDTSSQLPTINDSLNWDGASWSVKRNNSSAADPTITDDSSANYKVGSTWINTSSSTTFVCIDNTLSAAVWIKTSNNPEVPTVVTTSPYTVLDSDTILLMSVNSEIVNLPQISSHIKKQLIIKDIVPKAKDFPIVINPYLSETIDGETSFEIDNDYASIGLIANATEWSVV